MQQLSAERKLGEGGGGGMGVVGSLTQTAATEGGGKRRFQEETSKTEWNVPTGRMTRGSSYRN